MPSSLHLRLALRVLASSALVLAGCGSPVVPPDAAVDASATDSGPALDAGRCNTASDCDDGMYCNGAEVCTSGVCFPGPIVCDDDIACTIDRCSESLRSCSFDVPDVDLDGAGDAHCLDGTGRPLGTDCDDGDANAFPGNTEVCDVHDEDCDETTVGGADTDLDSYLPSTCCNPTEDGPPNCGLDCDDTRANVSRLAPEVCDGIDNDCDGDVDDGVLEMSWPDADMDGFGDATATPDILCVVPSSRANEGGDCDDANRRVHPFQSEECNGADDDCDGAIDEGGTAACMAGLTGTSAECAGGRCVVTGCAPGRFDCNRVASDGCEPLCTDSNHCGSCGHACTGSLFVCGGGHCPGFYATLGMGSILTDAITGAPIGGATITVIGQCDVISTTTAADGTWVLDGLSYAPNWARLEAPGYATMVQTFDGPLVMFPRATVDAWAADPDVATPPSPDRSILVVDFAGPSSPFIFDGQLGPANDAMGTDLLPSSGGPRRVFFGAVPGHASIGGSTSDGSGCSFSCAPSFDVWMEPGAVTYVSGISCSGVCS